MPDTNALLKNVAIFKDLDDSEIAEIAEVCREEKFVSGEYIFREGESGNRLYLICEGEVRISRDVPGSGEEALAILKPGALFGEDGRLRPQRALHARHLQRRHHGAHHHAARLRDAARLQSRDGVQGALVRDPRSVGTPAQHERFAAVVPRHVDVLICPWN